MIKNNETYLIPLNKYKYLRTGQTKNGSFECFCGEILETGQKLKYHFKSKHTNDIRKVY